MAELLIRVVDKTHADFYINATITKRGDVIVVQPDGWPWGGDERRADFWRILRVPIPLQEIEPLLAREPNTDPSQPSRTRQARAFRIDLNMLPPAIQTRMIGTRRDEILDVPVPSVAVWRGWIMRKPAISDPAILGRSPAIL